MRILEVAGELPPPLVADVHGSRRWVRPREEPSLRLEVVVHRPVQVQVILAQVREHEDVEAHAVETPQCGPVRACLDGCTPVARAQHLAEQALEVDRLWRRERRRPPLAAHVPLDRSDETRAAARGIEDRAQQKRCRRLSVRARHASELELLRRLAEERVGRDRHRLAHGRDEELWDINLEQSLDHDRGRPPLDCLPGEIVAVDARARHAEEQRALTHTSRVVGEVADLDRPTPGHLARRESPDQGVELHARKASCGAVGQWPRRGRLQGSSRIGTPR